MKARFQSLTRLFFYLRLRRFRRMHPYQPKPSPKLPPMSAEEWYKVGI